MLVGGEVRNMALNYFYYVGHVKPITIFYEYYLLCSDLLEILN